MATIGFIGAGHIGSQVARLAVSHGYDVVVSNSRGPATLSGLVTELGPRARAATADEGKRLEEPEGAPLLTMQRTTFDDTGRAVEFGSHVYRASRYAFEFQLLVRP